MFGDFLGNFGKLDFSIKNFSGFFLGNYWRILATFNFNIWSHWRQNSNNCTNNICIVFYLKQGYYQELMS